MEDKDWKEQFEKRADKTKGWGTILVIAVIAYFVWQSKVALFATMCSAVFFIENILITHYFYSKNESKNDN
jgi:hypothetical protein